MALQQNTYALNTNYNKHNHHIPNGTNNNNLNKNFTLPLTIIPLTEDALLKQQQHLLTASATKPPDLTFHCMCCEEYFVNPFHMYEHLNTKHAELQESQESEEEIHDDEDKDYSWVFEPVCELVAADEGGGGTRENTNNVDDVSSSTSSDSDSDDDSSSTSSSSSSTSSSSSSSSSNGNTTNTQDEATRDAMEVKHLFMNDTTTAEVMEEGAYEEVESVTATQINKIKLEPLDPTDELSSSNTPMLVLNPAANTTITPVLPQVRRGRGRRSAAQQAAIEMSSLISGEPKCFQCSHCEASFPSAGDLSKHVRCHITNKPFQCSICDKTFTHIGSLNTHIRIHSGEKPYKCELCSKAFTQSSSLMVHVRSHSIKKPYQCHLCDKGFVNSTSLAIHLKTHNESEALFSCAECDKTFKLDTQLNEHLRMHTLSLVYQCSICRNAFASSSELVQHMKCHMGEKPFTCSICDRAFTQSGSLNIHMRIHTGEKPFNCKFCNKSFTQASSLSVHLKIHSGDKPFPCHICGKSYSQAAYLNKHIQNHLEDQKTLTKVEPKMEPSETLLCIVCGELHRDANSLALHVTQKHAALLNNMQGATNNHRNLEISEEERLKQEQMYMQQIHMLMQMQHQMVKPPMPPVQQQTTPRSMINSSPFNFPRPTKVEENDMADNGGEEGDDEEEDYQAEETKYRRNPNIEPANYHQALTEQVPNTDMRSAYQYNERIQQDIDNTNNKILPHLQNPESCIDSRLVYNTNHNINSSAAMPTLQRNFKMDGIHETEVDYCEEVTSQKSSIERNSIINHNENIKSFNNENIQTDFHDTQQMCNGSPKQHQQQPKECENDNSIAVYNTNSNEYQDDSRPQAPMYHMNEHEMTSNHSGQSSPEYQEDRYEEEDNISYSVIQQRGVIQHHQSANVEYYNKPNYENDDNREEEDEEDMEAIGEHHEIQPSYNNGTDDCISDINDDIEMSDYPFVDDTKFDFYDDYAAEEEVETAE